MSICVNKMNEIKNQKSKDESGHVDRWQSIEHQAKR